MQEVFVDAAALPQIVAASVASIASVASTNRVLFTTRVNDVPLNPQ